MKRFVLVLGFLAGFALGTGTAWAESPMSLSVGADSNGLTLPASAPALADNAPLTIAEAAEVKDEKWVAAGRAYTVSRSRIQRSQRLVRAD